MRIDHISDTARWVAVYRAMETTRPDALFRDPFADRLAGERGHQIVDALPRGRADAWVVIVRTAIFDELILDSLRRREIDLVVNLAAGLDARPWRLPLPPTLRWLDIDLPDILNYKVETLRDEKTVCRYEALRTDLTDLPQRRELFARIGSEARRILVVSEGLLIYLQPGQVAGLAQDLHAQPTFLEWVFDLASPKMLRRLHPSWGQKAENGGSMFQFAPEEGTDFFRPYGWKEAQYRSLLEESRRLQRSFRRSWLLNLLGRLTSEKKREELRRIAGMVLLERG